MATSANQLAKSGKFGDLRRRIVFLLLEDEYGLLNVLVSKELVESELSIIFDGIISLRLRTIQDHVRKTICVVKLRGSNHDTGIRQFKITNTGIVVATQFEGATAFMRQLHKV